MKRIFSIILFACLLLSPAYAGEEGGIKFREGDWNSMLKQASKSNKLIFLDCYTSWCGPCKMLAKHVFTVDSVADFFNRNFICVKMDMEKGEGPELAKKYNIAAYPTLLFINGNGEQVHTVVGYQKPGKLLAEGRIASDGSETLSALQKRYDSGERDEAFVRKYIAKLSQSSQSKLQEKVATEFLNTFSDSQFYSRDCWEIFYRNFSDPMSPVVQKVFANRKRFYEVAPRDSVDLFLNYTFRVGLGRYTWSKTKSPNFNEKAYDDYLKYLRGIRNWEKKPGYIATLLTSRHWIDGDYRAMIDEMHRALGYGIFNDEDQLSYVQGHIIQLCTTADQPLLAEAYDWMQQLADEAPMGYYKSEYMKLQARILTAQGRPDEARDLEDKARTVRMSM